MCLSERTEAITRQTCGPYLESAQHTKKGLPIMPTCTLADVIQPVRRSIPFRYSVAIILGLLFVPVAVNLRSERVLAADKQRLRVDVPHISTDKSVKYDYDIVYV